jgi:ABC-2 type transport system permease protein
MNKTLSLIKREFKTKLFTKGFLISTMLGPLFIVGIIFLPLYFEDYSETEPTVIQVVDHSGMLAEVLQENFSDTLENGQPRYIISPVKNSIYEAGKEQFYQAIEDGYVDLLLIIPEDILDNGAIVFISATLSQRDFIRLARQRIDAAVNKIRLQRAGFDPGEIDRLTRRVEFKSLKISKGKETEKRFGEEWPIAFTFLMILYVTIVIYGAAVMRGVLEEKTSRILEILLSSSNSFQLMMGKLFGIGSVGLAQYLIWVTIALGTLTIAGASAPSIMNYVSVSPVIFIYFILFFVIGYFQFSTLYAAVGAMCSTQEDAQAMGRPGNVCPGNIINHHSFHHQHFCGRQRSFFLAIPGFIPAAFFRSHINVLADSTVQPGDVGNCSRGLDQYPGYYHFYLAFGQNIPGRSIDLRKTPHHAGNFALAALSVTAYRIQSYIKISEGYLENCFEFFRERYIFCDLRL